MDNYKKSIKRLITVKNIANSTLFLDSNNGVCGVALEPKWAPKE
jgi:hypothetical protein